MKLNIQLFAYTKKEWKDLPSKETPILAADLNNIENGIANSNDVYTKTEIDNKENNLKAENEYLNSVIEQAFTPVEKEGTSINYDNTINARFKDIKLCGDTTQNGTPTPDTPVPVETVTGNQNITVCGKNLFDKNSEDVGHVYMSTGDYVVAESWTTSDWVKVENNQTYRYSWETPKFANSFISEFDKNKIFIQRTTSNPFTPQSNTKYIRYSYKNDLGMYNIQIEKGNTATEYEPYQSQTYTINLGSIEFCKIGDYQDYIHKNNGKWYKHKVIGKVVLSGIEDIKTDGVSNNIYQFYFQVSNPLHKPDLITISSNYFKSVVWDKSWTIDNSCVIFAGGGDRLRIMTSKYTNANDFKAFLKEKYNNNKPIIFYYILATPIATEITDTTLLEQLEELAGATTYAGETNIVATSDGLTIIPKTTALTK